MDALLSALAGDLVGRLVSFLLRKYDGRTAAVDDVVRLQRALLRARAVVEEADGRQVTSQAMMLQLKRLRQEMCRCCFVVDTFRRRAAGAGAGKVNGALAAAGNLEAALSDMKELVLLLGDCPRVARQPYSAHLFMESCMFGRQMEKEQIIDFLLHPPPCSSAAGDDPDLAVLPIIGPPEVGKRTLVEHVCIEDRVLRHFSRIHRLSISGSDLIGDFEHRSLDLSAVASSEKSLFVVDLAGDVDEESWRRFRSSVRRTNSHSKILIISRATRHSRLGTAAPLLLGALRRQELWYFFRALAFGGADPEERPELLAMAVRLFEGIRERALFAAVNMLAASLRADLSARAWRRIARVFGEVTKLRSDLAVIGERDDPADWVFKVCAPVEGAPPCLFHCPWKAAAGDELPEVGMQDLLTGGELPGGAQRFDVLVWRSRIPPFCSYVATCDMERARQVVGGGVSSREAIKRRRSQMKQ